MTQTKKSSYALYPLLTDKIVSGVRQHLPGKERKTLTDGQVLSDFIRRHPDIQNDHAFYIMAEELFLKSHKSQVIFPESALVLDNLLKARYSLSSSEGLDMPFPSFILSPPRGYAFNGTQIPSLLVSWVTGDGFKAEVLRPFLDYLNVPANRVSFSELPQDGILSLVYRDRAGECSRTVIYGHNIPVLLDAKNPQEYRRAMVNQGLIMTEEDLSEEDRDVQFYSLKLIAALGVYHVATRGKKLKPGFPTPQAPRMEGRRADQQVAPVTLTNSTPPLENTDSDRHNVGRTAHYRAWHFRQLRDERYYRGEYANHAPGTRYTFVESALVGADAAPNTQF
ncbi:hypothetical protein RBE51_22360 [Pseudomonas taiwanensis]|uniref:hypothetical protein n=1 Tax=Pseudomonas taiwanensis TaxID=470150 RepID=UPI0028DDB85B|nr:hypothetical protein [Pseudomonas taiwanensis]MDT8925529.1 hypothetical protein [Pseudomonas taiwanensis]